MASFVVAALHPIAPPQPQPVPAAIKAMVRQMWIVDAANDQAAINIVATRDALSAGQEYLAIPFNPKKISGTE